MAQDNDAMTDELPDKYSWLEDVDTIVVDEDSVVKWWINNEHVGRERVFRAKPSIGSQPDRVKASAFEPSPGMWYEGSNHPIHIRPRAFLSDDFDVWQPHRSETRDAIADQYDGEPPEEAVDEAHEEAMDVYREEIKRHLKDEIDVFGRGRGEYIVNVEYK